MQVPHWLMLIGALLVVVGFLGHIFTRDKKSDADPASLPKDQSKKPAAELSGPAC
jgi:hypothetical protein